MKRLMILGGSRYILPVIDVAHRLECQVITCDYLPNNIAHKYSDEYYNISIIDKDAVLEVAKNINIDGIISFACDPGVLTAAYVAEKLSLPFQGSYNSVKILQDKGLFRKFLEDNGFNVPHSKRYTTEKQPLEDIDYFTWPVMVKPVDSAGSKGVTKVETPSRLLDAIKSALGESHSNAFIIEDFITFKGYHSSADLFSVDGELKFVSYSDQLFDSEAENKYTPAKIIWPTTMGQEYQEYLTKEIQRLFKLIGMKTGIYNVESCVGVDGKPYIMEVSPRGGGCKIAELQYMSTGVNLIENEVRSALGLPLTRIENAPCKGFWCEMILHAQSGKKGILKSITFNPDIEKKYIKLIDLAVKPGDLVKPFTGANMSLGDIFLCFNSRQKLDEITNNINQWFHIELE